MSLFSENCRVLYLYPCYIPYETHVGYSHIGDKERISGDDKVFTYPTTFKETIYAQWPTKQNQEENLILV